MTQHWPDMGQGDDAIDVAAKWFAKSQCGLSQRERAALLSWLQAAPENVAAMDLVSKAWTESGGIAGRSEFETTTRRWSARRRAKTVEHRLRKRRWVAATIAGAITCAAFAGVAWFGSSVDETYRTQPGQLLTLNLPDGSRFKLASSTSLHVLMNPLHRSVSLGTCEAEFDVSHNSFRPFFVMARDLVIQDVGTRFDVRNRSKPVRVVLIDGIVDIKDASNGQRVRLAAGEEATATPAGLQVKTADLAPELGWSDRRIVLQDVSLEDALDEWRVQSAVDFRLADPALRRIKISGTYSASDVIAFLNGLARVESVSWREISPHRFELRSTQHGS